jgi:hypothetical protein
LRVPADTCLGARASVPRAGSTASIRPCGVGPAGVHLREQARGLLAPPPQGITGKLSDHEYAHLQ